MALSIRTARVRAVLVIAAAVLFIPLVAVAAAAAPTRAASSQAAPAHAASLPVVWTDAYATSANDGFMSMATGPDGAVYAAGFTQASADGTNGQVLLAKYVDAGVTMAREWVRTFAWPGAAGAAAAKVAVDAAGNVIVAGTVGVPSLTGKGSDIVLLKYSSAGVLIWRQVYDGPAHRDDYVNGLALDVNGNALVVGASSGKGTGRDYVTISIDAGGSRAWVRRYAGPDTFDEARDVAVDRKGAVYVTGWSNDKDGTRRARTICYSSAGARRWIAGDATRRSWSGAAAIVLTSAPGARGVIISGYQGTRAGNEALMFTKYAAASGNVIWKRVLPSTAQSTEPHAAGIDGSGAPIAVGQTNETGMQGFVGGVSASGGNPWRSVFSSTAGDASNPAWAEFDDIAVSSGGSFLAGGWTQAADVEPASFDELPKAFVVRYSATWPATAPLDYIGPGSKTSQGRCTAVAISKDSTGMFAAGQQTGATGRLEAVLCKF
jgi:hypothetical protein